MKQSYDSSFVCQTCCLSPDGSLNYQYSSTCGGHAIVNLEEIVAVILAGVPKAVFNQRLCINIGLAFVFFNILDCSLFCFSGFPTVVPIQPSCTVSKIYGWLQRGVLLLLLPNCIEKYAMRGGQGRQAGSLTYPECGQMQGIFIRSKSMFNLLCQKKSW